MFKFTGREKPSQGWEVLAEALGAVDLDEAVLVVNKEKGLFAFKMPQIGTKSEVFTSLEEAEKSALNSGCFVSIKSKN